MTVPSPASRERARVRASATPHPSRFARHLLPQGGRRESLPRRAEAVQVRAVDLEPDFSAVGSGMQAARELPE